MSNLAIPKWRAQDINGAVQVSAIARFFRAGTSTPKAIYSNKELTSSLGTTLTADSNGWFARFYAAEDFQYKVRLETSGGVLIWEEDDLDPSELTGGVLGARVLQIASSPLDYGAAGDGVTDDATAVQDAIDGASGVVDLLGKTYRCDSGLAVPSNKTIRNGVLDFSLASSPPGEWLSIQGSVSGGVALTADGDRGDGTITLASVSGLAAGDWLALASNDVWSSSVANTNRELVQIESILGLVVTPTASLIADYLVASSATASQLITKSNVVLEDLRLVGNPSATGLGRAIFISAATDIDVRNVRISGSKGGFYVEQSAVIRFDGCRATGGESGFTVATASRDVVLRSCKATRMSSRGFDVGGTAIVSEVILDACTTKGDGSFIVREGAADVSLINCRARSAASYGIAFNGLRGTISGGALADCIAGGILFDGTLTYAALDLLPNGLVIDGVTILGGATAGILINRSDTYCLVIANCEISINAADAIVSGNSMAVNLDVSVHIHHNKIKNGALSGAGRGIWWVGPARIDDNVIEVTGAVACTVGNGASVRGNIISVTTSSATDYALTTHSGSTDIVIEGNYLQRSADEGPCVFLDAVTRGIVNGNIIVNGTYGINFSGCANCTHGGNIFTGQATAEIAGAAIAEQFLTTVVNLTAAQIVGTSAGTIGGANGVTLVPAVAGKVIQPVSVLINYTRVTASYTGGGDTAARHDGLATGATGLVTAGNGFAAGGNAKVLLQPLSGYYLANAALILSSNGAGFTQPGTAAGTAKVTTTYRLVDE